MQVSNLIQATAVLTSRKYRILSAVNIIEFVGDKTSHVVLRACTIIVFNVPARTEGKCDDSEGSIQEEIQQVFYHFPKYHMKILLREFNKKSGREYIFKPTIWNESLHQDSNGNSVRVANFVTSKNLVFKSMMFPHRNIH